jgi:hypothetical protein
MQTLLARGRKGNSTVETADFHPRHFDLADFVVAIARVKIQHGFPIMGILAPTAIDDQVEVDRFGLSVVECAITATGVELCSPPSEFCR